MPFPQIKIKKLYSDAILPARSFPTDSGLDLYAHHFDSVYHGDTCLNSSLGVEHLIVMPGDRVAVNTGISATVGPGYEIQVRPRSGLALKQGLTVLNTPGTVDESYRGPITVILINTSSVCQDLRAKTRIAQMVVCPVVLSEVVEVETLSETARSTGGFGHTGE